MLCTRSSACCCWTGYDYLPFILQDDLVGLRSELESEAKQLQQDRGKQERLATTLTNQMQTDAQVHTYILLPLHPFNSLFLDYRGEPVPER